MNPSAKLRTHLTALALGISLGLFSAPLGAAAAEPVRFVYEVHPELASVCVQRSLSAEGTTLGLSAVDGSFCQRAFHDERRLRLKEVEYTLHVRRNRPDCFVRQPELPHDWERAPAIMCRLN